ncbi:MAG: hypothetical protein JST79_05795 [Acidobacteria bacterium]|jgi:hypothetical protein|nr:hypothetical protein [Acidobacteriota bacterium]
MNTTQTPKPGVQPNITPAVVSSAAVTRPDVAVVRAKAATAVAPAGERIIGYGLPCAHCKTYYPANLSACPVCKHAERVSPTEVKVAVAEADEILATSEEAAPDPSKLEEERERFLREFKSQVYASHMQINAAESFRCTHEENHPGAFEPASVCQACHARLQEKVDHLEAALHIDINDAAQLVYEAVWADPSDPTKTYQNAAVALLTELRKRAGISAVLGPLQPKPH